MYSGEDLKGKQLPDDKDVSIITIIREEKTGCLALIGIIFGLATILTIAIVSYVIAGRGKVLQMALNCHFSFQSNNKTKVYDIQCVNQPYQRIFFLPRTTNLWRFSSSCTSEWFHELGFFSTS